MGGFSAAHATGAKRRPSHSAFGAATAGAAARPTKVPRASDVTVSQPVVLSKPTTTYRSLPLSAPVHVCMYKTTDCASDVWDAVAGDVPLYQIQVEHSAQRPITFHSRGKHHLQLHSHTT